MTTESGTSPMPNPSPSAAEPGAFERHHRETALKTRRCYLKAAAWLVLVLAAGAAIGVGGTLRFVKGRMHAQQPRAERIGASILERLGQTVHLTPDEKTRLENIVRPRMETVDAVRRDSLSAIREQFDAMNDEIDDVLGPERTAKWESDKKDRYGKFYRAKSERHTERSRRER